jgi:hypothetical protein
MSPKSLVQSLQVPGVGVSGVIEISELISRIRPLIVQGVEVLTPIFSLIAVTMIVYGIIMYVLNDFVGLRWIVRGIIILVLLHVVVPLLLPFL